MAQFIRQTILRLGQEGETGKEFTGLRIAFDVQMDRSLTPNKARIQAWNVSANTVALLEGENPVVQLFVGYDVPRLVFTGNPVAGGVSLTRQGVDRVLSIEAADGLRVYQDARVEFNISGAITMGELLNQTAEQMGVVKGNIRQDLEDLELTQGFTFVGPAREMLRTLSLSTGSDIMLRDGALQAVAVGGTTGELAVQFSAEGGNLIGAPTVKDGRIEVKGLLAPSLRPGKTFNVSSRDVNGFFTADEVRFVGESRQGGFYVEVVGTPIS